MGATHGKERNPRSEETDAVPEDSNVMGYLRSRNFHEALVRERDLDESFSDFYEIIECIGRGAFCQVFKVQKKSEKIGGSSRASNVRRVEIPPHKQRKPRFSQRWSISARSSVTSLAQEESSINFIPSSLQRERALVADASDTSFAPRQLQQPQQNPTEMYFALKEIYLDMVPADKIDQLKNEVEILKALDHKNVIKAYETFSETNKLLIVMELCTGGDLNSRFPYTEHRVARMVRQIVSAVSYMHDKSIIHRDLKLENVVFENEHPDSIIKLIDFGLSKAYSRKDHILSERVGTVYSMSPETLMGVYTSQADLWSIGVCTYTLLAGGQKPFEGKTPKQIVAKILLGKYDFDDPVWAGISDAAKQFIRDLLVVEPKDRLTAATAKHHLWLVEHESSHKLATQAVGEDFKDRVRESIVRYAETGDFLKLALNVIAKKSTSEEIFELRNIFDEFDTKNTGTLDMSEFKAALGHFKKYSEGDIEEIFRKIDLNGDNEINYTEFLASALETQGMIEEYRLAEAFDLLDCDSSGYISKENLRQILGDQSDDKYIEQLIAQADFLHDGRISYGEFLQAFNQHKQELVYSIYENNGGVQDSRHSLESGDSADEVLRRFSIIKGLRRAFNSNTNLKVRNAGNNSR